ncbi:MAG: DUF3052 family protein [Armatimonadetes bacterium]|nr:DUF3052 family protein [Armatimonadota bacterium]
MQPAGYSGTPLVKKLGFKARFRVKVLDGPPGLIGALEPLPEAVNFLEDGPEGSFDMVLLFATEFEDFRHKLAETKPLIKQNGMIWVAWPKKASKVPTELTFEVVQPYVLSQGLVDIKVCAIDDVWTGLKFVIPVKDRR